MGPRQYENAAHENQVIKILYSPDNNGAGLHFRGLRFSVAPTNLLSGGGGSWRTQRRAKMSGPDIEKEGMKPYVDPELSPQLQRIAHSGFLGTLRHYEALLDQKLGVEAHGPARILPEDRDPAYGKWSNQIVMALMWASGTMNLSCFTTGFLGYELGLSLPQTIWITIVGSFVGSAVTV